MAKSETPNIDELRGLLRKLDQLLADPHPGLLSWNEQYAKAVNELLGFFGA